MNNKIKRKTIKKIRKNRITGITCKKCGGLLKINEIITQKCFCN
jgi:uncharacterized OB-fold protein